MTGSDIVFAAFVSIGHTTALEVLILDTLHKIQYLRANVRANVILEFCGDNR